MVGVTCVAVLVVCLFLVFDRKEPTAKPAKQQAESVDRRTEPDPIRTASRNSDAVNVLYGLGALVVYLTPTGVAIARRHKNLAPIIVVNIFGGLLCVGWVVALAWAVSYQSQVGPGRQYTAE
jgi:hypothetical protein